MDIKEELEARLKRLEDFIEDKGLGSAPLRKAKRTQRNVNMGIALGSLLTVAGLTIWLLNRGEDEE